jgi:hypothetical protein
MDLVGWRKGIAAWRMGKALYLSVPFTWLLPEARRMAREHHGPVYAGGPAVDLMPGYLSASAVIGDPCPVPPLAMHNPLATFTTRGCPNRCSFCAVPRIEGPFRELADWPVRPIVCDNNLLASSRRHFDTVIDRLKALPWVDFNQGLDARLFTPPHARRIAELKAAKVRFAFDSVASESAVADAVALAYRRNLRDGSGRTYAIEVGGYFERTDGRVDRWLFGAAPLEAREGLPPFQVPRFHRTLSGWLNALVDAGFRLERTEEPHADDETVRRCPDVQDTQVMAYFLHLRCRK